MHWSDSAAVYHPRKPEFSPLWHLLHEYFKYDRKLLGKLCQCANKSLLRFFRAATRLKTGTVIYKFKKTPRKSKGGRKNFQVFTAAEFIAAITQHIPEKSFQLVRYYGWYSNRARGDREKRKQAASVESHPEVPAEVEIIDVSDYLPMKIPSPQWRECIKRVRSLAGSLIREVDPMACPKCGSEMKIISFITEPSPHPPTYIFRVFRKSWARRS